MNDQEILNRIREAIACLDDAANYISIESGIARKLHLRIQDAADGLIQAREEIQVRITVQDNARKAIKGAGQ